MTSPSPRPLIGLTCCSDRGPDWIPHAPEKYLDFLFRDYQRGVEFAGGIPVLIPIVENLSTIKALLDRIDGLILTGGPDVTTRFYGEEPTVGIRGVDYERDLIEIEAMHLQPCYSVIRDHEGEFTRELGCVLEIITLEPRIEIHIGISELIIIDGDRYIAVIIHIPEIEAIFI